MKISEFKRLLKSLGCRFETHGGRHDNWFNPEFSKYRVMMHKS